MRSYLLLLLFFGYGMAVAQPAKPLNNFTLQGTVAGSKMKVIWLRYRDYHNQNIQLSAPVKNGKFLFKGYLKSPVQAEFNTYYRTKSDHFGYITDLFINPGDMTVSLSADALYAIKVTGSVMQNELNALKRLKEPVTRSKDRLEQKMQQVAAMPVSKRSQDAMAALSVIAHQYDIQEKHIEYRFIQNHPNSYISPFLISDYLAMRTLPLDSAELFYNTLTPAVKNSVAGAAIHDLIVYRRSSAPGSMAPTFAQKDVNGKMLDLKTFRNKSYVLLEFWASLGSGPNDHNYYAQKLYQKYHAKGLEFIGINVFDRKKEWKEAILKDGISDWRHIQDQETIQYLYNIDSMPPQVFVLIDKSGKIIGRYQETTNNEQGNTTELDQKLTELLGR